MSVVLSSLCWGCTGWLSLCRLWLSLGSWCGSSRRRGLRCWLLIVKIVEDVVLEVFVGHCGRGELEEWLNN